MIYLHRHKHFTTSFYLVFFFTYKQNKRTPIEQKKKKRKKERIQRDNKTMISNTAVSHILQFEDATTSLAGDVNVSARDANLYRR